MTTGTVAVAAGVSEALEAVTTAVPEAYLAAFGEGGAVAASGLASLATVAGGVAALGVLGLDAYAIYKGLQQHKINQQVLTDAQAAIAQSQAQRAKTQAAIDACNALLKKTEVQVQAQAGATVPQTWTPLTPEESRAITKAREAAAKKAKVATPVPATVTKVIEATQPGVGGQAAPITVNITTPTPVVNVEATDIPQPLDVTGPMSAVQLAAIAPLIATAFATQTKQTNQGCFESTGQLLLGNILKSLVPAGIAAGFLFNDTLRNAMTSVAKKFVDAIYEPLTSQAPITPEKAPGIGAVLLTEAIGFGAGAHIMAVMAESSAPLKNMGLGYLAAFMADAAGFSRIAAAYQGMMIQWGLSQPMRYWALQHFRPMIPSEGTLGKLLANYAITPEEYSRYMVYHGYPDEWIAKLPDIAYKALSPMLFRYLGEAGLLDDEFIDGELKHAEYRPEAIPKLKEWLKKVSAGELKGQFASSVTGAYSKGLISPDDLKDHLGNLGYSEGQGDKAAYAAELSFATAIAEEMRATYLQQHKQGQITDSELGLQLSTLGYRGAKVNADVLKARSWFKPKPAGKVDAALEKVFRDTQARYVQGYITLYRGGYLDDAGLLNALVQVGVDPQVAEGTVFLEGAKLMPKLAE
jgi:hypothetical protein